MQVDTMPSTLMLCTLIAGPVMFQAVVLSIKPLTATTAHCRPQQKQCTIEQAGEKGTHGSNKPFLTAAHAVGLEQ